MGIAMSLPSYTSIFMTEAIAIIKALILATRAMRDKNEIIIMTDSLSCLKAFADP